MDEYEFKTGSDMSEKNTLDNQILHIVQSHTIAEQSELQELLLDKGVKVPQASLSRRLKKLGVVKIGGQYKLLLAHGTESLPRVTNMKLSNFGTIILHTTPGNANSLAYYLDNEYVDFTGSEVGSPFLGTIAGDDTVLIITQNQTYFEEAVKLLRSLFPYLN